MLEILKSIYRSVKAPEGRLAILYSLVRETPGPYGFLMRKRVMQRHFGAAGEGLRIHEGARFRNPHKTRIGDRVTIGVNNFLQAGGGITIGDDTVLAPDVKIWSANHIFADPHRPVREQGYQYREVKIGGNVWIGSNAFIMPGTELGDGCIVSAGSVVGAKNYPPFSILAGNPARLIGSRLKKDGETDGTD